MGQRVSIALDVDREVKFNINAMRRLESRFDSAITEIFKKETIGFTTIIGMLTIGLKAGGMKFKGTAEDQEDFVGDLVQQHWIDQGRTLEELVKIVGEALKEAGIFVAEEDKDQPVNPTQPTGD